jgi:hypothetical protein
MREGFRTYLADAWLWLVSLGAVYEVWQGPVLAKAVSATWLAIGPALVSVRRRRERVRAARAVQQDAVLAAEADAEAARVAAAWRARSLADARDVIAARITTTIVEVVAAQQALVRSAHPDDILIRLTAADDAAHAALTTLDQLPYRIDPAPADLIATTTGA